MRALLVGSDISNLSAMGALLNRRGLSVAIELCRKDASRRLEQEFFNIAIFFGYNSIDRCERLPPCLRGDRGVDATHFVVISSEAVEGPPKPGIVAEVDVFSGPVCGSLINDILATAVARLSPKHPL